MEHRGTKTSRLAGLRHYQRGTADGTPRAMRKTREGCRHPRLKLAEQRGDSGAQQGSPVLAQGEGRAWSRRGENRPPRASTGKAQFPRREPRIETTISVPFSSIRDSIARSGYSLRHSTESPDALRTE